MLQTENLHYSYNGNKSLRFPDLRCERGEHWLLLGQSGCGKTTLLHLLGGLLTPKSGTVSVSGTVLSSLKNSALDKFRGQKIGIIFQVPHFVRSLNTVENLALAQRLAGAAPEKRRIHELLEHLNLSHQINAKTEALSQGEQQRVAIARALVNRPALILADEPTSALDDFNTAEVIRLLEREAQEVNATLLVVTHDNRLKEKFSRQIHLNGQ